MGRRLADEVLSAATSQTVTIPAEPTHGRVVADLAGELDRLHARRDQLATDLDEAFLAHPLGPVLATLPGVGPRTGAKILAEIGDGSAFATGAQLAAYAGLAPAPASRAPRSAKGRTARNVRPRQPFAGESKEAASKQLDVAAQQGQAYGTALQAMEDESGARRQQAGK